MPAARYQSRGGQRLPAFLVTLFLFLFLAGPVTAAVKAPDFALPSATDGSTIKMSAFQGQVVLVNFFATWCPPCRREIPSFNSMQKDLGAQGFTVIGISVDRGSSRLVSRFSEKMHIIFPVAMADDHVTSDFGGIMGIPVSFLIDRKGNIVKRHDGYVDHDAIVGEIKALLQQ